MLIGDKLDYAYYTIILKKKKGWRRGRESFSPEILRACGTSKISPPKPGFPKMQSSLHFGIPFESHFIIIYQFLHHTSVKIWYYGEGGSRTLDTLRYTRFPSERTRPLCDLSIFLSISRQSVLKQKNRPGASA